MNSVSKSDDRWIIFEKKGLLISQDSEDILRLRQELKENFLRFTSLPELMKEYLQNPKFFNNDKLAYINILTDTNEIIGKDLEGVIYKPNEKVIVNTHGLNITSLENSNNYSIDENILSEQEFGDLLKGKIPNSSPSDKKIKVYREDELKDCLEKRAKIAMPCITVIHGDKYLKDPAYYCDELDFTQLVAGFKKNGLLLSRTLQPPGALMKFIKEKVDYFRQTSPLIEPVILNKFDELFDKYSYRVMPLILSDGQIAKEANDYSNPLDNKKNTHSKFFVAISLDYY